MTIIQKASNHNNKRRAIIHVTVLKRSKDKPQSMLREKTRGWQQDKREILKFVPKLRKVKKGSR